mgnify:CR=1 FL=1|jgi:hypothetical protein
MILNLMILFIFLFNLLQLIVYYDTIKGMLVKKVILRIRRVDSKSGVRK